MQRIDGLKCIYDSNRHAWAVELALETEAPHRLPIGGEAVETFLEAFEECSGAHFDPATGEVVFSFEYAAADDDDDLGLDEDDASTDEDETADADAEEGEGEEAKPKTSRKKG